MTCTAFSFAAYLVHAEIPTAATLQNTGAKTDI